MTPDTTPDPGTPVPEKPTAFGRAWVECREAKTGHPLDPGLRERVLLREVNPHWMEVLNRTFAGNGPEFLQRVLTRMHEENNDGP